MRPQMFRPRNRFVRCLFCHEALSAGNLVGGDGGGCRDLLWPTTLAEHRRHTSVPARAHAMYELLFYAPQATEAGHGPAIEGAPDPLTPTPRSRKISPSPPLPAPHRCRAGIARHRPGSYCGSARLNRRAASPRTRPRRAAISAMIRAAAQRFVPVDPPHDRPIWRDRTRAAAMLATSGTA
jgi:hypothetical protein